MIFFLNPSPIFYMAKHPAMLRGTARERLMSGLLLSLFFQPLLHYVPPPLLLTLHPVILRGTAREEFENVLNLSPYISLLQNTEKELKIILSDNEDCIAFSFCERPTARLSRILLLVHRGDVSFGHAAFPTVPCTLYR